MYRYDFPGDPHYDREPAEFVREAVRELTSYEVVPDPTLTSRLMEIDSRTREIRMRPGMTFRRFHSAVDRAVLYVVGGSSWAPEFHVRPKLAVVRDVPMQRGA